MRVAALLASLLFLSDANAQIYFTGALTYGSDSSGNNTGGAYEYDTFVTPDTFNSKFSINGATDIAFALSPGANLFVTTGGSAGPYTGLGLFFSSTAATFTGPFAAAPNLVVGDDPVSGTTFFFAAGGAMVSTYGQFSAEVSYSGATSYQIGGYDVTVTAFDFGGPGNNLTLFVTPIPEPAADSALAGILMIACALAGRRRRAVQIAAGHLSGLQ